MFSKTKQAITHWIEDYRILMKNVPPMVMVFFVLSVCLMNLFANKELLNSGWIALDCGFCLSWLSFLCMDMLTRRFGTKASITISLTATVVNGIACIFFWLISLVPGNWGAFYDTGSEIANQVLDSTIGGTWYVVLGSMTAFVVSSIVNALVNQGIGKLCRKSNFKSFALRSYISTALGQFVDNLIFSIMVSYVFFGWNIVQVITCSLSGAIFELLAEVVFSPIGYRICRKWERSHVGESYLAYLERRKVN